MENIKGKKCQFSNEGLEHLNTEQREGVVAAEPRNGEHIAVLWEGTKTPQRYARKFIAVEGEEGVEALDPSTIVFEIRQIARAVKALDESDLRREAIVTLLHEQCRVGKPDIRTVLNAVVELEDYWLKNRTMTNTHPTTQQVEETVEELLHIHVSIKPNLDGDEQYRKILRKALEDIAHTTAQEVLDRVEEGVPVFLEEESNREYGVLGWNDFRTATLSHITKVREDYKGKKK